VEAKEEKDMFKQCKIRPGRCAALVGLLAALLLALPLAAAFASQSGDDAYDPAAGGRPKLSVLSALARSKSTGTSSYSGDDIYDPAAMTVFRPASSALPSIYSGDDAYDPAAWHEARTVAPVAAQADPTAGCGLSTTELRRRAAWRMPGSLSGDAAYDPAAGGVPELSLQASAQELGLAAACLPQPGDN
jgi:hypothetical protein